MASHASCGPHVDRRNDRSARAANDRSRAGVGPAGLLALQNQAGNRAVAGMIERARARAGHPLPGALRSEMEEIFGAAFDEVRLHADHESASINDELESEAFSIGHDIFLRAMPNAHSDRNRVLGHELAHVMQQRSGRLVGADATGLVNRNPSLEAEAHAAGQSAARGRPASVTSRFSEGSPVGPSVAVQLCSKCGHSDCTDESNCKYVSQGPILSPATADASRSPILSARRLHQVLQADERTQVQSSLGSGGQSYPEVPFEQGGGFTAVTRTNRDVPAETDESHQRRVDQWQQHGERGNRPARKAAKTEIDMQDVEYHPHGGVHSDYEPVRDEQAGGSYVRVRPRGRKEGESRHGRHGSFGNQQTFDGEPITRRHGGPANPVVPPAVPEPRSPPPSPTTARRLTERLYEDPPAVLALLRDKEAGASYHGLGVEQEENNSDLDEDAKKGK